MKKGQGKRKGNAFEREVCRELSLWVTSGKRDDVLWRSAMSGGRATVHAKKGRDLGHVAGDICSVADEGRALLEVFLLECKFYRDLNAARLLFDGTGGRLHDFWLKTVEQARFYNKLPMLIAKQNLFNPLIVVESDVAAAFDLKCHLRFAEGDGNVLSLYAFVRDARVSALKKWRGRRPFRAGNR